jgi:hypothetical protein
VAGDAGNLPGPVIPECPRKFWNNDNYFKSRGEKTMGKGMDSKKDSKKAPAKSMKEKKAAKKAKKDSK